MSIPIEGLVPQISNQEKNSVSSTETPLYTGGRLSRRGNRFQNYLLAGLTLSSPLIAACGTAARAGDSPTVPEATAEAFTQQNPDASTVNIPGVGRVGLEPVPQSEPPKSPEEKIIEVVKAQQEAKSRGEDRIAAPEQGEIKQGKPLNNGEQDLFVVLPPNEGFSFPALIDGEVLEAARVNRTTNLVEIRSGNLVWFFLFPLTTELLVKKGQRITLGVPIAIVKNDPDSPEQRGFEQAGAGKPPGTVAAIASQSVSGEQRGSFAALSINGSVLTDSRGKPLTVPTLSTGKG